MPLMDLVNNAVWVLSHASPVRMHQRVSVVINSSCVNHLHSGFDQWLTAVYTTSSLLNHNRVACDKIILDTQTAQMLK